MSKSLAAWIGTQDLDAPESPDGFTGPIGLALNTGSFDRALLLANQNPALVDKYAAWLRAKYPAEIEVRNVVLEDPTDFSRIYEIAIEELETEYAQENDLTFHLSPGTPAMAAIWIVIAKTKYPAKLIQSSIKYGVKPVDFPFELAAEYQSVPGDPGSREDGPWVGGRPRAFGNYQYQRPAMLRFLHCIQQYALAGFPVLIQGEPGTEVQHTVQLLHQKFHQTPAPIVDLDCRQLSQAELDGELFNISSRGEGAGASRGAAWVRARGGTLCLSHVDFLPMSLQAKLSRLLQSDHGGQFLPPRLIASSYTDLKELVRRGLFLPELYHLIGVLRLRIPPLRERKGDVSKLIDNTWEEISKRLDRPGGASFYLSPSAKNALIAYEWPGNLLEMESVLKRIAVQALHPKITEFDVYEAGVPSTWKTAADIDAGDDVFAISGVDLRDKINKLAQHYILKALEERAGNKTEAARLLHMGSHQNLSNWMKKLNIPDTESKTRRGRKKGPAS